jgi:hypothetical protein
VIDVAVFAVDSRATVPGAIRSGQDDPAIRPLILPEGRGGGDRWIDELSNGLLLNR